MTTQVTSFPRYVLADLLPGARVRDTVLVVGGAAFVGLASQASIQTSWVEANLHIPLPGTPVPLSLSTFAVLLTGMAFGAVRGAASMLLFLLAGMAGMPWFADQASGWAFASFGYIIGYVVAAAAVGLLAQGGWDRTPFRTVAVALLGTALIYLGGVPWLMAFLDLDFGTALELGVRPFLVGDLIKAVAAAGLLPLTWSLVRRIRQPRDNQS